MAGRRGYFPLTYVQTHHEEEEEGEEEEDDAPPPPIIAPSPAAAKRSIPAAGDAPPIIAPSPAAMRKTSSSSTTPTSTSPTTSNDLVRGLYDYTGAKEGDLSFKEGDVLSVHLRHEDGWLYGASDTTGQKGWFPLTYVESIKGPGGSGLKKEATYGDGLSAADRVAVMARLTSDSQEVLDSVDKPGRFLVHEGPVVLMANQVGKEAYLFLMSDCLITANSVNEAGKHEVRNVHLTHNFSVVDLRSEGENNYVQIKLASTGKNVVVAFASPEVKDEWLEAFTQIGVEVHQ